MSWFLPPLQRMLLWAALTHEAAGPKRRLQTIDTFACEVKLAIDGDPPSGSR